MKENSNDLSKESAAKMIEKVLTVFNDINKTQTSSKAQTFELVKLFKSNPIHFQAGFELAYLKIFKIFHERANRKMPPKYEQLATTFFQELLSKDKDWATLNLLNFFLRLLSEGVFSTLAGIRITTARMLFHLIKLSGDFVNSQTKKSVLTAIFYLLRLKVSTYKQIGIKLASLTLTWVDQLRDKVQLQLFKILAVQENQQIRRMTMTNILMNPSNIDRILLRLRDKCPQIRSIIIRKLIGQKYKLESMSPSNRYHLLYDGYGNKQTTVQQQTLKYFTKFFDPEHKQYFTGFVEMFRPNLLLLYPHLYTLFDGLLGDIIEQLPLSNLCQFIQKFTNQLKQVSKNGLGRFNLKELIWLKNIGKSQNTELKSMFDQCIPSGLELSRILLEIFKSKDIFSIYECLQIFGHQKSTDQIGRNKMFDALKKIVIEMEFIENECLWQKFQSGDICPPFSEESLKQKKMMLSYFDLPMISNSYDLIYEIGNAMKALWPDHYEIQLKQIMAQWNNPQQNTLMKEKELTEANIRKLIAQGENRLIDSLKIKLSCIQEQLQRQGTKTRIIILALNRLKATSMDDFMPIIKQDLAKKDQSQGLILLGLYCLDGLDKVETFMPLYWMHLNSRESSKLHTLVSLKVTTDFMVKFDLSNSKQDSESDAQFTYESYIKQLLELVMDRDPDIRILAIQGLCRIIYHSRIKQELLGNCFLRLLLLWWETSSEEVSARSVHTISIFVKQYIQRGAFEVRKLSESLCIFFKILLLEQSKRRTINKKRITYNLKMEEFVKRSVIIAMTVLKYHKQSRQIIWKYQQSGAQLGPQELFLLFLFKESDLHFSIERAINICDFYEDAPLETLILIKKHSETILEKSNFINNKKLEIMLKKLQTELEEKIQIKNQETFNEQLLNGLKKQLHEYQLLIESAAIRLSQELEQTDIFIENTDIQEEESEAEPQPESEQQQGQLAAIIAEIQEAVPLSSEEQSQNNKKNNKNNLSRISERYQNQSEDKEEKKRKTKKKGKETKIEDNQSLEVNKNRKRRPPQVRNIQSQQQLKDQNIIPGRTRSRHRL